MIQAHSLQKPYKYQTAIDVKKGAILAPFFTFIYRLSVIYSARATGTSSSFPLSI